MPRALIFALLLTASPASAQEQTKTALPAWPVTLERVSQGAAGAVYIDPASVARTGDVIDVRVASIPPQESDATSYMWSLERIDCKARTVEKRLYVRYTEDGRVLGSTTAPPAAIPPGAQALERISRVCAGSADAARTATFMAMPELLKAAWPIIDAEIAKLPPRQAPR
jgi:hypothetical protein